MPDEDGMWLDKACREDLVQEGESVGHVVVEETAVCGDGALRGVVLDSREGWWGWRWRQGGGYWCCSVCVSANSTTTVFQVVEVCGGKAGGGGKELLFL